MLENGVGSTGQSVTGRRRAEVVGLGRAAVPAFLLRCRLAHPQCYGGAAALLSGAPGAAVHLPLPLQVKGSVGHGRGGGSSTKPGHPARGIRAPQV